MKKIFREIFKKSRRLRNIGRWIRARVLGDLGWSTLIENNSQYWNAKLNDAGSNGKVLVATSFGGEVAMPIFESLISAGLIVRGVDVSVLLCDGLPACQLCDSTKFKNTEEFIEVGFTKKECAECFNVGQKIYKPLGIKIIKLSDYLDKKDYEDASFMARSQRLLDAKNFVYQNVQVGEHALAGACRYFAMADFESVPNGERVYRKYLHSSILVAKATENILHAGAYNSIFMNHGIYVPQGVINSVAHKLGVRISTWNTAYRRNCFIFSHNDTYHHTMMTEPINNWCELNLTAAQVDKVKSYIESRASGKNDWIKFNETENSNKDLYGSLGIDCEKPLIGLLTNVAWDAQLHYPSNAFPNMIEWILHTVAFFIKRPDLQLLIRVHPAELTGHLKSNQLVMDEIYQRFSSLPSNIFIINSNNSTSTYDAMKLCDSVIIYGTKTGVELTTMGIPVIVAGEAWIRNKGITHDISSIREYDDLLNSLPIGDRLSSDTIDLALKYAYHFFFRRMVPFKFLKDTGGFPQFLISLDYLTQLESGNCHGFDLVCNGIIDGDEYIYKDEFLN